MDDRMNFQALELPTLILNKSWQAVNASTVKDAIGSVCADRARILHPVEYTQHDFDSWMQMPVVDGEPFIKLVGGSRVKVPEIIVLNQYDKVRNQPVVFSRRNLWKRDNYTCQYCGVRPRPDELTIDHVLPKSRGGKSCFPNCVLACVDCNKRKDNRTPEEAGMRLFRWVKGPSGEPEKKFYKTPKTPHWSPLYAVRRQHIPASWSAFVKQTIDDRYWDTELET
jgi:hypothetical protein